MENKSLGFIGFILLMASSLTVMSGAILSPTLPLVAEHYSDINGIGKMVAYILLIPNMMMAMFAPFVGGWLDKGGRKKIMLSGILIYGIFGVSGYFMVEQSFYGLLAVRAIFGLGTALNMVSVTTLVGDFFQGPSRNTFSGIQGAVASLLGICMIFIAGRLADMHFSYPFLVYTWSFLVFFLVLFFLPEPVRGASAGSGQTQGEEKMTTAQKMSIGYILLLLFVGMAVYYSIFIEIGKYIKRTISGGGQDVSIAINTFIIGGVITSFLFSKIRQMLSWRTVYTLIFLFMGTAYYIFYIMENNGMVTITTIAATAFLAGFGSGVLIPNSMTALLGIAPPSSRGLIMGLMVSFTFLGNFASGPLFAWSEQPFLIVSILSFILGGINVLVSIFQKSKGAMTLLVFISILGGFAMAQEKPEVDRMDASLEFGKVKIAGSQMSAYANDFKRTKDKIKAQISEAADNGAKLITFSEGILSGYPIWNIFAQTAKFPYNGKIYKEFYAASVRIPEDIKDIIELAKVKKINVVLPVNERDADGGRTAVFNTMVYISLEGKILGTHRKSLPSFTERYWWAAGDGTDLAVYDMPEVGRVAGMPCWENYMPLLRYYLYSKGVQIYLTPTLDFGPHWDGTIRHIAREGRVFVLNVGPVIDSKLFPEKTPSDWMTFVKEDAKKLGYIGEDGGMAPGGSSIAGPDGEFIVEPVYGGKETIIYATVDKGELVANGLHQNNVGGYARTDMFDLIYHNEKRDYSFDKDNQKQKK